MLKDFSNWEVYDGAHEGSGRSEKIWLINSVTGQIGLFKFKKDLETKDHVSEKLASDLAALLEIPCAQVEIGTFKQREGSMSYLINKDSEELIEGISLINQYYPNYSAEKMYDSSLDEQYSIHMLVKSIRKYGLLKDLLKMLVFDYLIGNSDRHQNNWAIIKQGDGIYKFSPLYDNSSSLCCYVTEDKVQQYLGNDLNRLYSLVRTKSRSIVRIDAKRKIRPTHEELLIYINQHYHHEVKEFIDLVKLKINDVSLNEILMKYPEPVLSQSRKNLIKRFIIEKVKLMVIIDRKEA